MSRLVAPLFQTHLDGDGTTVCWLLKIVATNGMVVGVTSHDIDVPYDDGEAQGEVVYSAVIGLDQSPIASTHDLEVNNAEAHMLLADSGSFTQAHIDAGVFDEGSYVLYRVNWANTSDGHYIAHAGTTGVVTAQEGLLAVVELRGLAQYLKQTFVPLGSVTCRAVFGSTTPIYRACNFDAEALWQSHTVDSLGAEADRDFTADSAPAVSGPNGALDFVPGLILWLTGDNAGAHSEVEDVDSADIVLRFETARDIQLGDTFKIRPDCAKRYDADCIAKYDNKLNFRGEPRIPLADESTIQMPGGQGYPIYPRIPDPPVEPPVTP